MMVLPLLLITVLPKMMNDPETKREMEQMHQSMNVQNQVRSEIYKYNLHSWIIILPLSCSILAKSVLYYRYQKSVRSWRICLEEEGDHPQAQPIRQRKDKNTYCTTILNNIFRHAIHNS